MKTVLHIIALILCSLKLDGAILNLNGDLTWNVTEPRLTFKMDGGLQNNSPSGTVSGTIKLVLWVTKFPYPSVGSIVGEYTLGQISGGYQFSDFTVATPSNVPNLTGDYYFTITVMEYTTSGWLNRLIKSTGTKNLTAGNFTTQAHWRQPIAKVIAPPPALTAGKNVKLTLKATGDLNRFPSVFQTLTTVSITSTTMATIKLETTQKTASYTYKRTNTRYNGKRVQAANLFVDYADSSNQASITLYFQGATTGTYKSVAKVYPNGNPSYTETTWGSFSLE